MKKVRNSMNYDFTKNQYEVNNQPSLTVPDQTMSLKEMLRRFASGIPMENREPIWYGEDSDPIDPRRLDLAERQEIKELYTNELNAIKERINKPQEDVLPTPSVGEEIS